MNPPVVLGAPLPETLHLAYLGAQCMLDILGPIHERSGRDARGLCTVHPCCVIADQDLVRVYGRPLAVIGRHEKKGVRFAQIMGLTHQRQFLTCIMMEPFLMAYDREQHEPLQRRAFDEWQATRNGGTRERLETLLKSMTQLAPGDLTEPLRAKGQELADGVVDLLRPAEQGTRVN